MLTMGEDTKNEDWLREGARNLLAIADDTTDLVLKGLILDLVAIYLDLASKDSERTIRPIRRSLTPPDSAE
jgi:hypothetical protein